MQFFYGINLLTIIDRFNDIQSESITASKKTAALELKWNELKNLDECEELFNVSIFFNFLSSYIFFFFLRKSKNRKNTSTASEKAKTS